MGIKRWLRDCAVAGSARMGYTLLPSWKMPRQPMARHLRDLFARCQVDCVFDVGGNLGQFRDLLRDDVGYKGWILSFEPISRYVGILRERAKADQRWEIFDLALGDEERALPIHVTNAPGLSSFLAPRTDMVAGFWQSDSIVAEETVTVRRFDAMFDELSRRFGFRSPYLKLDTQGYDLSVIRGAGTCLDALRAIQTEASVLPIYVDMPDHREVISYLESAGFALSGVFPVTVDDDLRLVEYDCIMIRQSQTRR